MIKKIVIRRDGAKPWMALGWGVKNDKKKVGHHLWIMTFSAWGTKLVRINTYVQRKISNIKFSINESF